MVEVTATAIVVVAKAARRVEPDEPGILVVKMVRRPHAVQMMASLTAVEVVRPKGCEKNDVRLPTVVW